MSKGTYVAATDYELRTKIKIDYLIKSLKVPNPVDMKSLHTTLAYSRRELPLTMETKTLWYCCWIALFYTSCLSYIVLWVQPMITMNTNRI